MISKTENEIMESWKDRSVEVPVVTVRCMTYNHEKYIRKAIESFLSQITNFSFEIIVHDDASTDKTTDIIREYESKYPHILKPIYETENQYSKHDGSIGRIMNEHTQGDFIAVCEGDDYWCDERKLQKQYDYMITHKECSLCCHNTVYHDLNGIVSDCKFNKWTKIHKLTDMDIFFGWNVHTSSYFYRRDLLNITRNFITKFGDYVLLTSAIYIGDVIALPDVMSVYNANVPGGATSEGYFARIETMKARRGYLKKYNEFTNGKFKEIINLKIAELTLLSSTRKKELIDASCILKKSKQYNKIIKNQKFLYKIKFWWKVYGSVFGNFWYKSMMLRFKVNENE